MYSIMDIKSKIQGFVIFDRSSGLFFDSKNQFSTTPRIWGKLGSVKSSITSCIFYRRLDTSRENMMAWIITSDPKFKPKELDWYCDTFKNTDCVIYNLKTDKVEVEVTKYVNDKIKQLNEKNVNSK